MNEPLYCLVDLTKLLMSRIYNESTKYYGWFNDLFESLFNNSCLGGCRCKIFFSVLKIITFIDIFIKINVITHVNSGAGMVYDILIE